MITKQAILILSLLVLTASQQNCSPNLANDQLQTGTYTFPLSANTQRIQCYTVPLTSAAISPLQLSYGIQNILNFQNSNTNTGVDFSLRGNIDSANQQLSFTLIVNNGSYGSITISYLIISNRKDLIGGSYITDTNLLLCGGQQTTSIAVPVSTPLPSPTNSIAVIILINGIRTQSWLFNLKFQQPLIDLSKNQINITLMTDSIYPIETIFLSYLIMDLTKISVSYSYSFTMLPIQSDFSFSGIVAISNTTIPIQYAYVNINKTNNLVCAGFNCSKCLSNASCTAAGGMVSGTQCNKCAQNQIYTSGVGCSCASGFNLINGVCKTCPTGTTYNALLLSCSPNCNGGQQWINGGCACKSGTYLISDTCGTCPQGTSYNTQTSTCSLLCTGVNQVYSNGQCKCINGFKLTNNICVASTSSVVTCPSNQYILNNACRCYANYIQYQGNCYSCPPNSAATTDQSGCTCNQGYSLTSSYTCVQSAATFTSGAISTSNGLSTGSALSPSSLTGGISTGSLTSTPVTTTSTSTTTPISTTTSTTTTSIIGNPSTSSTSFAGSFASAGVSSITNTPTPTKEISSNTLSLLGGGSQGQILWKQCTVGAYYDGKACQPCSQYCLNCFSNVLCVSCSSGFLLVQSTKDSTFNTLCNQICGDGKRFTLQCDDGNTLNGDGCNSKCITQSGWTCSGGSSTSKDTCKLLDNITTQISILKNVIFGNALYQSIMISPLPSNFTANGCLNCSYLLNATLVNGPIGAIVSSNFIPATQYQYVLTVIIPNSNFNGIVKINLSLNTTFAGYFSASDIAQQQLLTINLTSVPVLKIANSIAANYDRLDSTSPDTPSEINLNPIVAFLNK